MATATNHKAMELEGSLGAFPLADVMRILAMGRMTGILRLESSEHAVELSIKDGRLIGTASPERFLKLGQLLVYNGLINRRDLDEVLLEQREHDTGLPLGELLIDRGLVTREQVEHALRLQVKEEMWELFSWTDGSFRFEHGATPAMAHGLLSLDINRLLEEGEQHMSHWREIAQNLQNPHQVFAVRPDLAGFPEERLRPNVWKLLSLINGRHSLQTLVYMAGLGRFETLCGLDTLLRLNLIMPVEHPVGSMGSQRSDTGDVETQPDVEEAPVTGAQGRPGALLGLFGRRGGRGEGAEGGPAWQKPRLTPTHGPFFTSVGMACALINQLAQRLLVEPAVKDRIGKSEPIAQLWLQLGMRFPRADLIQVCDGLLDPRPFEHYVQMAGGITRSLAGCHDDSLEALAGVAGGLMELAEEHLGERAGEILRQVARPFIENPEIQHPNDFMPRTWARQWAEKVL